MSFFYLFLTFLKVIVGLAGMVLGVWYLIKGFSNNDKIQKSKGIKYFLVSIAVIVLITILEFSIALVVRQ